MLIIDRIILNFSLYILDEWTLFNILKISISFRKSYLGIGFDKVIQQRGKIPDFPQSK